MLYFLKQTFIMHESHSFLTHFPFICYNDTNVDRYRFFSCKRFYYITPLTLTSFKAMDVTLKYARFLKIGNVVLYKEMTILMLSKFQYTQCIGSRPAKLKPTSRGFSSEWYTIFVSNNFLSEISQPDYVHVNTCNNFQIMHPNANIDETWYFV